MRIALGTNISRQKKLRVADREKKPLVMSEVSDRIET